MPKRLSKAAVTQFKDVGYHFPVSALSAGEAAELRGRLEEREAHQGGALLPVQRNKSHLLFKWIDDLIRDPRILDPVEDLIGPDLLCWNTLFWIKNQGSPSYVSWHQDLRYWGLDGGDVITAWLALSPASEESGCMRVMPHTHVGEIMPHEDRYDESNMLTRGQEIISGIDEEHAIHMPLQPGEMSLHNARLAHASGPNMADDRRIGLSMHFIPPTVSQGRGDWDSAALVRGSDPHGHFRHTPRPKEDFDPDATAFHEMATKAVHGILYKDADQDTKKL